MVPLQAAKRRNPRSSDERTTRRNFSRPGRPGLVQRSQIPSCARINTNNAKYRYYGAPVGSDLRADRWHGRLDSWDLTIKAGRRDATLPVPTVFMAFIPRLIHGSDRQSPQIVPNDEDFILVSSPLHRVLFVLSIARRIPVSESAGPTDSVICG
jgi:hypothetical protein